MRFVMYGAGTAYTAAGYDVFSFLMSESNNDSGIRTSRQ